MGCIRIWNGIALLAGLALVGGCERGSILGSSFSDSGGANSDTESVLELFSGPTPVDAVRWATDPVDPDKRMRGTLLLASAPWGGEDVYLRLYRSALEDEDAGVRAVAMRALALHGTPEDVPAIVEALETGNGLIREEASRALQRLHSDDAIPALLDRVDPREEENRKVRRNAAIALGQYAERRVVSGLISALDDRDLTVNRAARRSLRILTGQDFEYDPSAWLAWTRDTGDVFAARGVYEYPAFSRDASLLEMVVPWMTVPNEIASTPVGMDRRVASRDTVGDEAK